jgi:hypothetical protein
MFLPSGTSIAAPESKKHLCMSTTIKAVSSPLILLRIGIDRLARFAPLMAKCQRFAAILDLFLLENLT